MSLQLFRGFLTRDYRDFALRYTMLDPVIASRFLGDEALAS
jgi:hypothetical protein